MCRPGYVTPERIAKAKKLELALTAGIGSDHVDLPAASKAGITVAEITGGQKPISGFSLHCFALSDAMRLQYGCVLEAGTHMFCWSIRLLPTKAEPCCQV